MFNWLSNNELFCIERTDLCICQICGLNKTNTYFLFPLISILLDHLKLDSLNDIIMALKEPSSSSYYKCSFTNEKNNS